MGAGIVKFAIPIILDFIKELFLPSKDGTKSPLGLRVAVLTIMILSILLYYTAHKFFELHTKTINQQANVSILTADRDRCEVDLSELRKEYFLLKNEEKSPIKIVPPTQHKIITNKPVAVKPAPDRRKMIHEINNG